MALDLNDKTANGNTLTNVNGATDVTASLPFAASTHAADLESSSTQYFTAADSVSLSITGNLTIEQWVKFESLPSAGLITPFVTKHAAGDSSWFFGLTNDTGTLKFYVEISANGTTSDGILQAWTPSTGTWYHIAFVYTAATSKYQWFVDGSQVGVDQNGIRTSIFDSAALVYLGNDPQYTASPFDGVIDEVRIWNTARTVTELTNNKSIELTGAESGLAAYWPFEALGGATAGGAFLTNFL